VHFIDYGSKKEKKKRGHLPYEQSEREKANLGKELSGCKIVFSMTDGCNCGEKSGEKRVRNNE